MKTFRVFITAPADRNFRDHFEWIRERSIQGSENWRQRIIAAIRTLDRNPEQHAPARESLPYFPLPFDACWLESDDPHFESCFTSPIEKSVFLPFAGQRRTS